MQYIVSISDMDERIDFYNDILKRYELTDLLRDGDIESRFPFVVDFNNNTFWVCTSITCLAAAAQCGKIMTIKQFRENTYQKRNNK